MGGGQWEAGSGQGSRRGGDTGTWSSNSLTASSTLFPHPPLSPGVAAQLWPWGPRREELFRPSMPPHLLPLAGGPLAPSEDARLTVVGRSPASTLELELTGPYSFTELLESHRGHKRPGEHMHVSASPSMTANPAISWWPHSPPSLPGVILSLGACVTGMPK